MKKFRVTQVQQCIDTLDVEAETEEAALEMANDAFMYGIYWSFGYPDLVSETVEEIDVV